MRWRLMCLVLACGLSQASTLSVETDTAYIGRVDTIGGTTYDWIHGWSALRNLVNAPAHGIHAAWVASYDSSPWPDRDVRYNYYDYSTRAWNWIDSLQSGINVFTERVGFGNIDVDPQTGVVVVCAHGGSSFLYPQLARDIAPGAGLFEYSSGAAQAEGHGWPVVASNSASRYHLALGEYGTSEGVWYSRVTDWDTWLVPCRLASIGLPWYNIAGSKVSDRVCVAWPGQRASGRPIHFIWSSDGGNSWSRIVQLDPPDAFGGDTAEQFSAAGCFPFYDDQDRLHFGTAVQAVVNDTPLVQPVEMWHWCQDNEPDWAEIHRAECGQMHAGVGYNVLFADRPSLGQGGRDELYVSWEQFDSSNVEPQTELLRAGIWLAASADNGANWDPGLKITERNTASHRYPCIVDRMVSGGPDPDTVAVLYLMDQVAGAAVMQQGPVTMNPVVCQFVPVSLLTGITEEREPHDVLSHRPCATIVSDVLVWQNGDCPSGGGPVPALLLDEAGRVAMPLQPGENDIRHVAPGVYFVTPSPQSSPARGEEAVRKVVVQR